MSAPLMSSTDTPLTNYAAAASPVEIHREHDAEVDVESDDEEQAERIMLPDEPLEFKFSWRKLWRFAGPGWLMSLAYLDPGNLESDLQEGAYTGYRIVWVLWWATVMGLILQEMSARIGIVTGRDLAQTVRAGYPRWLNYVIYVNMEIAVIAADIQEVVGTSIAINLLSGGRVPIWMGCLITTFDTFSFLMVQRLGVRYLEGMVVTLMAVMTVCFFINWHAAGLHAHKLLHGLVVPSCPEWGVAQAVGTIGAVIMPHNLYLHSGLVLSRKVDRASPRKVLDAIWYSRIECAGSLLVAFLINTAVVATNSAKFYAVECASVTDADGPMACLAHGAIATARYWEGSEAADDGPTLSCERPGGSGAGICAPLGLEAEGAALSHSLGQPSLYIWALGLFAAGQAATMVCTYSGQMLMNGMLELKMVPWKRVTLNRTVALLPALLVASSITTSPRLLTDVNEWLNILQSLQLPFAMLPVLHFGASRELLGPFRTRAPLMAVCILMVSLVMGVNAYFAFGFIADLPSKARLAVSCYCLFYIAVCVRLVSSDLVALASWVWRKGLRCGSGRRSRRGSRKSLRPLEEQLLWPKAVQP
mmetsp:Transcript_84262/g.252709  ORF Transcript_84262/g.252709 Transcript_84262/m.252709 type:complete len:589 (+) Transcript_84262:117-1883(+)